MTIEGLRALLPDPLLDAVELASAQIALLELAPEILALVEALIEPEDVEDHTVQLPLEAINALAAFRAKLEVL